MPEESNVESPIVDGFLGAAVSVEEQGFGPQYPVAQWVNGSPKQKNAGGIAYTGGFFISADQLIDPEELAAAGFEPYTLLTEKGEEVKGFSIRNLTLSPIRFRRAWRVTPEGGLGQMFSNEEYDEAVAAGDPRGVSHVLSGIKGISQPINVSFRGLTSKEVMGMGRDRGIIPSFGARIPPAASGLAKKSNKKINFPLCAFSLTIGPEVDEKGKPKFTTVGQGDKTSEVTHPYWVDEPQAGVVTKTDLDRLFVGNEAFARYQDYHRDANAWVDAWSTEVLSARRNRGTTGSSSTSSNGVGGAPSDNEMGF